jgi:hypothetical protein
MIILSKYIFSDIISWIQEVSATVDMSPKIPDWVFYSKV